MTESTPPAPPPGTAELFGDAWDAVRRYVDLLVTVGIERGLLGPRESGRVWERHIRNCMALEPFIPAEATVIDLGSGAGLPGIPLALARPDLSLTLLEPLSRRAQFLSEARDRLGGSWQIAHERAEDTPARADVVVCRAVAPLLRLLALAQPLVNPGGRLLALKGRSLADELDEVRRSSSSRRVHVEVHDVDRPDPAVVVEARWPSS